ncbi:MAG: hypothetical protein EXQ48_05460 [Acidobacteria bacterium]|nr:hypothetical protein [Acidobacteriota bacterium]
MTADATMLPSLVAEGATAGTPYAMAPEQVRGDAADARSDIWALGVLLYEMAAGARPFRGESLPELFSSILRDAPAALPASVPADLEAVIGRCLEKVPDRRFQHASEVAAALERTGAGYRFVLANRLVDSIAVLLFVNASDNADVDYLSDGITESLINSLSQLPNLAVRSRTSVFRYKGRDPDAQAVGQALDVRAVLLTGRVVQQGDRLAISAQLTDVRNNRQLWGEQYNRALTDILTVQDDISTAISDRLRLTLTGEERKRLVRQYTQNTEVYQLYLRGRFHWNKKTVDGFNKGIEYFEQAIALDPNYAPARAGLAALYNNLANYNFGLLPPRDAWAKAKASATRARELDNSLASAHTSLALVAYQWEWDWAAADREFTRALELDPGSSSTYEPGPSSTYHWYAHYLMTVGRVEESFTAGRRALELDPVDLANNAHQGWHYLWTRQYGRSVEPLRKAIEMDPTFPVGQ